MDEPTYAPRPGDVKKVIIVTHSGGGISTYESVIDALTAVYRLDAQLREAVETAVQMVNGGRDNDLA
mgnify:CR=1 FL=1|jgi:hypothetical protein